ncbi:hypothetical protein BSA16_05430 [Micromonospora sp. Rc5]|nr:hypothetical protein BSA16_05430 [Micromonospora sp. Rc5]
MPSAGQADRPDGERARSLVTAPAPVPSLVARQAADHPDRVAVVGDGQAVTYAELLGWADDIALRLRAAGVGPGQLVGVLVEPSVAMVAAVLGVFRADAGYVPVDRSDPGRRLGAMFADAGVVAVVTSAATRNRPLGGALPRVDAAWGDHSADVAGGSRPVPPADEGEGAVPPTRPAYVIYTSGSTGEPKGVLVEHGQLAASTLARRAVYPGAPTFLLVSPLAFDSSVAGLWGTLSAGGTLVVAGPDDMRDPDRLTDLVHEHRVTQMLCLPSLYARLLDAAARGGLHRLRSVRTVVVAGEPLPQSVVTRHFAAHPEVVLVNEYGPTETTVWATYRRFDGPGPVSIGGPVPGASVYVLGPDLRPVPPGEEGELFVGGGGVSRGYLGRPGATALAFLPDPFAGVPGARMYRTGDLVRRDADGTLHFIGRRDHQVKVRGHRVELGAVEASLRACPGVGEAAAVVDSEGELTAFVVADDGATAFALRHQLSDRLPVAAVPTRFRFVDGLPLTVSGKVDRGQLNTLAGTAAPAAGPGPAGAGNPPPAPPGDRDLTAQISAAWAEVLQISQVPTDVNFFDLGGHSMAMFRLQDALEQHTGIRPSVVALFRHTTIAAQAEMVFRPGRAVPAGTRHAAVHTRGRLARSRPARTEQETTP